MGRRIEKQLTQDIKSTRDGLLLLHLRRIRRPGSIRSDIAERNSVPLVRIHAITPSQVRIVAAVAAPERPRAAIIPTQDVLVDSLPISNLKAGP